MPSSIRNRRELKKNRQCLILQDQRLVDNSKLNQAVDDVVPDLADQALLTGRHNLNF